MFIELITNYMKVSNLKLFSIIFIGMLIFSGCGGGSNASRGTGWDINSKFLGYQVFDKNVNLSSQPYDILPEINVGKRWDKDLINFDLRSSLTQWDHASKVDGTRADIQIGFDKTFNMRGLSIKPRLKVQHTSYDLDNQTDGFTSTPSKTIPIFTLDNQLTLSKQIKNTKIAHQIKPRNTGCSSFSSFIDC